MNQRNFFAELKRRNVYKVAVAYAVVGWLLVQVATQVFPFLEIPNWVVRLVIELVAIGVPIALVIAWAFESSPKGIDRTMMADALNRHSRGRAWIYVAMIRAAGKVRVNAQLIDTRNDAHVWAQTYDRDLADVFAIQSETAQTIAELLRARLSPVERAAIAQPPTTDVVANDLYVRAQALDYQVNDPGAKEGLLEGVRLLEEAVKRDPNFLLAYCLLCEINLDIYWCGFDHTDARREQANRALQRAEQIRPDAGEVHLQKGAYAYHGFREYERARTEFELARRLLPNSGQLYTYLASVDRRQARWDDAIRNFARACELDPRNV